MRPKGFARVEPHPEPIALLKGKILIKPNTSIEHVDFPESGVDSVVALDSDSRPVGIGIVGWEGIVGSSVILGSTVRLTRASFRWTGPATASPPRT
jgi:hypothetical protein